MNNQDWKGNTQSVMATLNASNHSDAERASFDYYATPRIAVLELLRLETFNARILEPACGELHISKILESEGYEVESSDIIKRADHIERDFFSMDAWNGDIVTNPPFAKSTEFLEHALNIIPKGNKVAFFLRIQFLEGVKRRKLFNRQPPARVWVASRTLRCAKNGDFANATGNASTYIWCVFEKGFTGKPALGWFN